ncbi:glycoside hydrolase family 16 protein [Pendulispora rubella]|uniref:Glycoside hydrolase family 16 protein n=1 Tax=Pendulispora rubella TaxID=2741070 RepID=A0ABZ2KUB8_9BACT
MAPSSRTRKHRLAAGTAFIGLFGSMSACYWLTSTDDLTRGNGGSGTPDGSVEGGPGSDANNEAVVYPPGSGWKLTFRDEFNGDALGAGWATEYPREGERAHSDPGNNEVQWYLKQNVVVSGGTLKLIAKREDHPATSQTFHYTSGMVQSKSLATFQYGYVEAKIKWPKGSGLHPAFWSWPTSESSTPELDIASFAGHEPGNVTCILNTQNGQKSLREIPADNGDWTAAWHTYAVDSEPNRTIWYFDGQRVYDAPSTGGTSLYLMLTFAISESPPATGTTLPATYEIDYVRVFTK